MRQDSPLFRGVVVCLFLLVISAAAFAQDSRTAGPVTEGSLRVMKPDHTELGLCPLKRTDVKADVSGFISRVTVTQTFQNPLDQVIEAVYKFPLPNDAAVDALTIETGGRIVRGKIMPKQLAKEAYEAAKQQGKVAALLEQERPDIFTQSVANITPGGEIKVVISYVETLRYSDDSYEFRFPMTIGSKYMPSGSSPEDEDRINPRSLERPGHTIALEINVEAGVPVTGVDSSTHEIEMAQFSASKLTVKLKDGDVIPNKDFVLRYKTAGSKIEDAILSHRDARGGFFTLILQPPDRVVPADAMPKEVVFVLDTSGSMSGFPINKARESMKLTLDNLNPSDTFNLITFAGETRILFPHPVPATRENLDAAKKLLDRASSGGGTEMMKAIVAALEPSDSQSHVRITCFMTDGEVGNEGEIINEVRKHPNARVFAFGIGTTVNHRLLDEITREGRGEVEYVSVNDDGSAAARRFFERIRNPLMTDISLEFKGVDVSEVYPREILDLFDAKPVTVTGRYKTGGRGTLILRGMMQGQPFSREIAVNFPDDDKDDEAIASIWARKKLAEVMRPDFAGTSAEKEQAITGLGLDYHLVTSFTSFVAVEEEMRASDGSTPKRVDVPVAEPENGTFIENAWVRRDPAANVSIPPGTPGGVYETVTVTSSRDVINTSDASISTNVTTRQLTDLPANGRSSSSLYLIAPGVQVSPGGGSSNAEFGATTVNGQRATSNQFTVDGLDANRGVSNGSSLSGGVGTLPQLTAAGGTNSLVAFDATSEIQVKTFASAANGRTAGGTFSIVTKSGTNAYHGSLFETFGNEKLNASDPFARAHGFGRAPSRLNLFGGTFGGPFVKDKAFFFGNYEGMRLRQGSFGTTEVPTAASRLAADPSLRTIFNAFPVSNGPATSNGLAEFSTVFSNPAAHDIFGFRTDIRFTDKFSINVRYNFAGSNASWRGDRNTSSLNTLTHVDKSENSLSVQATYTVSSNMVAHLNTAVSRNTAKTAYHLDTFGGATPLVFPGNSFIRYDIAGRAGLMGGEKNRSDVNEFQTNGTFEWVAGSHLMSFGADVRRLGLDIRPFPVERNVLFSSLSSGGTAARVNELRRTPDTRSTENFSVFGQDEWRVTPKLTIIGGLRWDMDHNPNMAGVTTVVQNASTGIPNRLGNFAPRFSAAFDPAGNGKSVIRAGVGLYYDFGNAGVGDAFVNSYPYVTGTVARNVPFNNVPVNALNPLALFAVDLKTPHTFQAFTEYQREIIRNLSVAGAFVATYGRDLLRGRNLAGSDPNFAVIRFTDSSGRSDFQALELRLDRRFADKFSANARYSWSRSTDNVPSGTIASSQFVSQSGSDRGASDADARHTLSAYGSYDLPQFISGDRAKWWANDWTISASVNARSANPVNVTYSQVTDLGIELYRPNVVPGILSYNTASGLRAINPAAFSIPNILGQGSLERNVLRGFPLFQLNAAMEKQFKFGETSLRIKAEAFNVLNTVNYQDMSGSLGTRFQDGTFVPNYYFGKTIATLGSGSFSPLYLYGGARTIQLSAKFAF